MAVAPIAELSTRLVIPMKNKPDIEKIIKTGIIAALRSLSFSAHGTFLSSGGRTGPSSGWKKHLTRIYIINITVRRSPGNTPASHSLPTG